MLRPLNPTTCHCPFSWSHWFISMSQSQLAVLFPHAVLSPSRPYLILPASVCLGPVWKFFSYYQLMVLGSKLSSLEIGSDSWVCTIAFLVFLCPYLCWHRQLSADVGSPREQHIGKQSSWVLKVPCILMLTTQSSQYFRTCSQKR